MHVHRFISKLTVAAAFLVLCQGAMAHAADALFETTLVFPVAPDNKPNYRIPAIVQAPNGDLLIFAEKRNDGPGDIGNHDIVFKRSRDRGRTWSDEQVLFDDENRVCTDLTLGLDRTNGKLWLFFLRDKKEYTYFTSTDNGHSWQGPVSVHKQVTRPEWDELGREKTPPAGPPPRGRMAIWEHNWYQRYGIGPGNAIVQLTRGPKAGRLVVPARHREDVGRGRYRSFAHTFYSDDHGQSWKLGGTIGINTSECQLVELADGRLMVVSRDESSEDAPDNLRHRVAISIDGGETWGPLRRAEELITPRCHGAVERLTLASEHDRDRLLFSSVAAPVRQPQHPYGRYNLTIRLSYDEGETWTAGKTIWPHPSSYSDIVVLDDMTIGYVYERGPKGSTHYWDEIHFARFNLEWLTDGRDSIQRSETPPEVTPPALPLAQRIRINGIDIDPLRAPAGLQLRPELGLVTAAPVAGQVVHRTTSRILETRATQTPGGDYLLLFPEGNHYALGRGEKMNTMMEYRSSDGGRTWQGPRVAFDIDYSQHGFIPFIPRGSKRIYAFGTQPIPGQYSWEGGQHENAPIGFRWSDDDGRTWSDVQLIRPTNDPQFKGMSVMRMTETDSGVWLLGSHVADWSVRPIKTKQYVLRSADRGQTWTVLPGARPNGWFADGFDRMDEGRPINLGDGRVLLMSRTPAGRLFTAWSDDDGATWTTPAPSPLVHPDAPPMLFPLSDGKTLAAFHHNRTIGSDYNAPDGMTEDKKVRSELWVSLSRDGGQTWSEPRFVLANAVEPNLKVGGFNYQCSYLDAFTDGGVLQMFLPHRWQQVLHLTLPESDLEKLPTRGELEEVGTSR